MIEKRQNTKENWIDPDDAPEWSDDAFARAEVRKGGVVVRPATDALTKRGLPKPAAPKEHVSLSLDQEVVEHFKAADRG